MAPSSLLFLHETLESLFGFPKATRGLPLTEVDRGRNMTTWPGLRQRMGWPHSDLEAPAFSFLASSWLQPLLPTSPPPLGFMPQLCEFGMIGVLSHLMTKGLLRRAPGACCACCAPCQPGLLWPTREAAELVGRRLPACVSTGCRK